MTKFTVHTTSTATHLTNPAHNPPQTQKAVFEVEANDLESAQVEAANLAVMKMEKENGLTQPADAKDLGWNFEVTFEE